MPTLDTALIVLAGIALFAAFVNSALGYGFSSLTVPLALLFYTEWWPLRNLSRSASESVSVDDPSRGCCGPAKLSHFQISYMGRWLSANAQARKYTHGLGTNESPFHPDFQTNAPPTSVFANTAKSRCCCLTFASRVQVI
jgi:hypothetical protein